MSNRVEEFRDPVTGEVLCRVGEPVSVRLDSFEANEDPATGETLYRQRELTPIDVIVCARCPVFLEGTSTEGAMCAPCQLSTHEETIIDLEKRLADAHRLLKAMYHHHYTRCDSSGCYRIATQYEGNMFANYSSDSDALSARCDAHAGELLEPKEWVGAPLTREIDKALGHP